MAILRVAQAQQNGPPGEGDVEGEVTAQSSREDGLAN